MNSCYNDKFFDEKWGGPGRPSRPASDGPGSTLSMEGHVPFRYGMSSAQARPIIDGGRSFIVHSTVAKVYNQYSDGSIIGALSPVSLDYRKWMGP